MTVSGPRVDILILNWNRCADTIECVESCRALDYPRRRIIVVDNHSTDESVRTIRERFADVAVIENDDNYGYAGGNNAGLRRILTEGADYAWILNNDVVVDPASLRILVEAAEARPKAGLLAPRVNFYDDRGRINSLGTEPDWLRMRPRLGACHSRDNGRGGLPFEKPVLVGSSLLIRRRFMEHVGLLDEDFYMLHEDAEWCLRGLKKGFRNVVVPGAVVYHKVSRTLGAYEALAHYYGTRNFLYLARKHATALQRARTRVGLAFLACKHAWWGRSADTRKKAKARAFFLGVRDYRLGRTGRCPHAL